MNPDKVQIDLERADIVVLRVILEVHMLTNGETEQVRRLHDMFANISLHTSHHW